MKKVWHVLFLLAALAPSATWAGCRGYNSEWQNPSCVNGITGVVCATSQVKCGEVGGSIGFCKWESGPANIPSSVSRYACNMYYGGCVVCDTQAETDSVKCALNPDAPGCESPTAEFDERCENVGGVPHYHKNANGTIFGYCDICNNPGVLQIAKEAQQRCCAADQDFVFSCVNLAGDVSGTDDLFTSTPNGSCRIKSSGIDVNNPTPAGCRDDYLERSSSSAPNSSSEGAGQTSSSSEGSGGEGSSPSEGGDSTGMDWEYDYRDSLHNIMDSIHNVTNNIQVWGASIVDAINEIVQPPDTFIIAGDTIVVNVSPPNVYASDSQHIREFSDSVRKYLSALDSMTARGDSMRAFVDSVTGARFDSVLGLVDGILGELGGLGSDSTAKAQRDTIIDTLGHIGHGVDSLLGFFDDSNYFDGVGDSIARYWAGVDLDSVFRQRPGDSSRGWGYGLTSAADTLARGFGNAMAGLRDSGAIGAYNDSLNKWAEKFNYDDLKGSGCPTLLNRHLEFNLLGASVRSSATIGQYICSPVAGLNKSLWDIGVLLLRAAVATGCMLFLFRCATGANDD